MSGGARSLQRTLTVMVITIVGAALAGLSATVYAVQGRGQRERFDERLVEGARAAALLVGGDAARNAGLASDLLATIDQSRGATSLQLWSEDGSLLASYPPLASPLPRPAEGASPRLETVQLPDGGMGRLYRAWLDKGPTGNPPAPARRVGVTALRATERLERRLARLRALLWATTLATVFLSGLAAWLVVRRSLRSVARVSTRIGAIDPSSLRDRLEVRGLPDELRPAFEKVNELLSRIEQVMSRERQFSADVSHELRTPLSGLRTILEVAGSRERSDSEHRAAQRDALEVVRQLEAIVENLLALARLGAGQLSEEHGEEVELAQLVDACFAPLADRAGLRRVRFDSWIAPGETVVADRLKLRLIASNLLSNAVQYTAEGGWITVESAPADGLLLRVRDCGPAIPESALERIFDPFFRLDRSRSGGGEHCGIGLTLVRGLCETSGYRVTAENEAGGAVTFTIATRPPAGSRGAGDAAAPERVGGRVASSGAAG